MIKKNFPVSKRELDSLLSGQAILGESPVVNFGMWKEQDITTWISEASSGAEGPSTL